MLRSPEDIANMFGENPHGALYLVAKYCPEERYEQIKRALIGRLNYENDLWNYTRSDALAYPDHWASRRWEIKRAHYAQQ